MKNFIRTTHGYFSVLSTIITLYVMLTLFKPMLNIETPIFKLSILFIYIPIFLSSVVLTVKGISSIFNAENLFIGNIFKFKPDDKVEKAKTKNTTMIGIIILCIFLIDMVVMIFVNFNIILPMFNGILLIGMILLMINTIYVFLFGVYRIIME